MKPASTVAATARTAQRHNPHVIIESRHEATSLHQTVRGIQATCISQDMGSPAWITSIMWHLGVLSAANSGSLTDLQSTLVYIRRRIMQAMQDYAGHAKLYWLYSCCQDRVKISLWAYVSWLTEK